jgi:hypothetical protein
LPFGWSVFGAGRNTTTGHPPFVIGNEQLQRCACASPAKPVAATEANANVTINDFNIFVSPEICTCSPAARFEARGLVASLAARQFVS